MAFAGEVKLQCDKTPASCISLIDRHQQQLNHGSLPWWELEQIRFETLFAFQQSDDLYVALRPWVNNSDVPANYQPVVASTYAKWLHIQGRDAESKAQLQNALDGFRSLNRQNESKSHALKILNTLVLLRNLEQAGRYARELIERNYDDPVFNREIYAELAHIAHKTNAYQQHIDYRHESLRWALKTSDEQQKAIAYQNYAAALQINKDYKQSKSVYADSLEHARRAGDTALINKITLRLAQVSFQMADLNTTQEYLNDVDLSVFTPKQVSQYRKLSNSLVAALSENY